MTSSSNVLVPQILIPYEFIPSIPFLLLLRQFLVLRTTKQFALFKPALFIKFSGKHTFEKLRAKYPMFIDKAFPQEAVNLR